MPKFRLTHGLHITNAPGAKPDRLGVVKEKTYVPGDIIDAEGLEAACLAQDPDKFEALSADGSSLNVLSDLSAAQSEIARLKAKLADAERAAGAAPAAQPTPAAVATPAAHAAPAHAHDLERMNVAELKAYAAAEEIDLGAAQTKADILRTIRAAK